MGIGTGIFLVILGLILLFALNLNLPYVTDDALGIILILGGIAVVAFSLILQRQRTRTQHVTEHRYGGPPVA